MDFRIICTLVWVIIGIYSFGFLYWIRRDKNQKRITAVSCNIPGVGMVHEPYSNVWWIDIQLALAPILLLVWFIGTFALIGVWLG
jgi:hypothetical protein